MDLGSYVAERRKALGLVQSSLAEELHYSVQAISRFERGQSQLSLTVLPHLADLLKESFDDLLHCVVEPAPFNGTNKEINEAAFAENLLEERKGKGLSQKELASKLGIGERSLQNYEKGNSLPSLDVALAMVDFFQATPSLFFCEPLAKGNGVIKAKKGWRFFVLPALLVVVVGGGSSFGIAYALGAFRTGNSATDTSATAPSGQDSNTHSSGDSSSASTSADSSASTSADSSAFSGLNSLSLVSEDGANLAPGYHKLTLVSEPADYFVGRSVKASLSLSASRDRVAFPNHLGISYSQEDESNPYSPFTLKITSAVSNNVMMDFTLTLTLEGVTRQSQLSLFVANVNGDLNSEFFPGLQSFVATISSSLSGPFTSLYTGKPGDYYLSYQSSPADYVSQGLSSSTYSLKAILPVMDDSIDPNHPIYQQSDADNGVVPLPFTIPSSAPSGKSYSLAYQLTDKQTGQTIQTTIATPFHVE